MQKVFSAGLFALAALCAPKPSHAATPQCTASSGAQVCTIDRTIDPAALCNDGTVPVFSYRPGTGTGANRWLIWLEGGSECYDQVSCTLRATVPGGRALVTSNGFTAHAGAGVMSASSSINPSLYNVNAVYVHYCSSDTWAGNRAASGGRFSPFAISTWHFQGRRIAVAAVASLRELIPSLDSASQVIIGGDSAGGVGITLTANDILPLLPRSAQTLLINDAGFALNIGQFDASAPAPFIYTGQTTAFASQIAARLAVWNARGDAACDAGAATAAQHINCYDTSYVLKNGYIHVPSFVAESQLDTAQIRLELCPSLYGKCAVPSDPGSPQGQYAVAFGARMAANLQAAGTRASYASFSPDEFLHLVLNDDATFTKRFQFASGGMAPRDALAAWLANPGGARATYTGDAPGVM